MGRVLHIANVGRPEQPAGFASPIDILLLRKAIEALGIAGRHEPVSQLQKWKFTLSDPISWPEF